VKRRRWGGEGEEVWKCEGVKIELTFSLTPNPKPETPNPKPLLFFPIHSSNSIPRNSILETPNNLRTFAGKNE
jgi:hypothetical protein